MFLLDWIRTTLAYFGFKRNANILVIGLDNAGKTTLLQRMGMESGRNVHATPTRQSRSRQLYLGNKSYTECELGGSPHVRRVLRDYSAIDAVVFMVDSADHERFAEAKVELNSLLSDEIVSDIPIAILFNKVDLQRAASEDFLVQQLDIETCRTGKEHVPRDFLPSRPCQTFPCSVVKQLGYGEALRWLAYYVN